MEAYTTCYEEYLDSQITDTDMFYLESEDLARQLVELGYRGSGDTLKREEFEARKKALRDRSSQKTNIPKQLSSAVSEVVNGKELPRKQLRGTAELLLCCCSDAALMLLLMVMLLI